MTVKLVHSRPVQIALVVLLNATIAFVQESKAEASLSSGVGERLVV